MFAFMFTQIETFSRENIMTDALCHMSMHVIMLSHYHMHQHSILENLRFVEICCIIIVFNEYMRCIYA